jgi:hypothetical protein
MPLQFVFAAGIPWPREPGTCTFVLLSLPDMNDEFDMSGSTLRVFNFQFPSPSSGSSHSR